ncbi:hypothetical protein [Paracoccus broussonetiae]|nr:hypothetical protein [Paracoccus sp. CPCC 101403]
MNLTGKFSKHSYTGMGLALLSCAMLAACATTEEKTEANPDHLVVNVADGNLTGSFNPAGFDDEVVKQALAANCVGGKVATYSSTPADDGLTSFTATCDGGTKQATGTFTYQRASTAPAADTAAAAPSGSSSGGSSGGGSY